MENSSESGSALFENWSKFQKEFFDKWGESAENFQKVFKGVDRTKDVNGNTQDIFSLYQSWKDTFGKYFDVMIKNNPINVNTDTMSKLFSSADVYVKLYEFWEPLIKAFQERAIDPDSYKDLFDPSKYKEMINKVFGFSSPETMKEFYDQTSKLIETWGSKAQLFVNPWTDAIQKNINAYHDFSKGDYEAAYNIFHNLYSGFESTSGKAFKMPAVGKDREEIELMLKTLDRYSVFLAKNTEFQHKIYLTGQDAMEKVIESIAQKTREKEDITSFNEFVKKYKEDKNYEPTDAQYLSELGNAYAEKAMFDEAIITFKKVLELEPGHEHAHYKLGLIYSKKGMFNKAADEFRKTIKINPRMPEAHYNLGLVYHKRGMIDTAISEYESTLSLLSDAQKRKKSSVHYKLGLAYYDSEMYEDAIHELHKALEITPKHAKAHYQLSMVYKSAGMLKEADEELAIYKKLKKQK